MKFIDNEACITLSQSENHFVGESTQEVGFIKNRELCASFTGINALLDYLESDMPVPKNGGSSSESNLARQWANELQLRQLQETQYFQYGSFGMQRDGRGFQYPTPEPSEDFFHFESYEEAVAVYRKTPSRVREFQESDAQILGGQSSGCDVFHDVTGDFLDIGRFLEEEPECFGQMTGGNPRGQRVNLYVNLVWPGSVAKTIINERGQRIQRLVDWLENQQVRTSVMGLMSSNNAHVELLVKDHDEPLDINDVAVFSHGDFFRRLMFRVSEYSKTWSHGYGDGVGMNKYLRANLPQPELAAELSVVIGNKDSGIGSAFDDLEAWLTTALVEDALDPADRTKMIL